MYKQFLETSHYTCFLSTGEILQAPEFRTVYHAALYRLRDVSEWGANAALFVREDGSHIAGLCRVFGRVFIWRDVLKYRAFFESALSLDKAEEYGGPMLAALNGEA